MRLHPFTIWKTQAQATEDLLSHTLNRTLTLDEGTAGCVWRTRKPVWTTNVVQDMCLPRSLDASFRGLREGIWFAVKTETVVYGVVELLGEHVPRFSGGALVAIEQLGMSLGHLIETEHSSRDRN